VGAADEVEVVGFEELRKYVGAEEIADASLLVLVPALLLLDGVGPEEVAEHALGGDVGGTIEREYFFDLEEFGTDAAVHAEYLLLDDGGDGHGVEGVGENLPEFEGELALACIIWCLHSS
jgi:hypothetical protein